VKEIVVSTAPNPNGGNKPYISVLRTAAGPIFNIRTREGAFAMFGFEDPEEYRRFLRELVNEYSSTLGVKAV
jgi:hypothetical protein